MGKRNWLQKNPKRRNLKKKEEPLWSSKDFQAFEELIKRGDSMDTIQKTLQNKDPKDVENKFLTYERAGLYKSSSFEKKN